MVDDGPREVVRGWLADWNRHDPAGLAPWVADGYLHHASSGSDLDFDGFVAGFDAVLAAFPDLTYEVAHLVVEGDLAAAYLVGTGTHQGPFLGLAGTGRTVRFAGCYHARVSGGRIVEDWDVFDLLGPAFALGARLG